MKIDWKVRRKDIDIALLVGIGILILNVGSWINWFGVVWILMASCLLFQKEIKG